MTLHERLEEAFDKRVCGTSMLPASDLLSAMSMIEQLEAKVLVQIAWIESLENHIADSADTAAIALRKAWQLGQTYWQQADSDSYSQQDKSAATQERFSKLVSDTCLAINDLPEVKK